MRPCHDAPNGCACPFGNAEADDAARASRVANAAASRWSAGTANAAARRLQQPGQVWGFASKLLADGGDLGCVALGFEAGDQRLQPRPEFGGVERFVTGQSGEVAKQLPEAPQPAFPRIVGPFPGATPQRGNPVIKQRQAGVRDPQHGQAQEAGDLDRPVRVLDPRQCRELAQRPPPGEMLQPRQRQIRQDQPGTPSSLRKLTFSLCSSRPLVALLDGTALGHSRWLISPPRSTPRDAAPMSLSRPARSRRRL
jgi:hypothetical protein